MSRSTHGGLKSKTYVATKKGKIYLRHNSIHEDVPIAIALKALGIQSDKEILLLTAGNHEAYKSAFSPNLEEAAKLGVFTRHQALEWIGSFLTPSTTAQSARTSPSSAVKDILDTRGNIANDGRHVGHLYELPRLRRMLERHLLNWWLGGHPNCKTGSWWY